MSRVRERRSQGSSPVRQMYLGGASFRISLTALIALPLLGGLVYGEQLRGRIFRSPLKPGAFNQPTRRISIPLPLPLRGLPVPARQTATEPSSTGADQPSLGSATQTPDKLESEKVDSSIASRPAVDNANDNRSLLDSSNEIPVSNSIVVATEAEKNQKIAEGWEKPWACLLLTGRQHGYIEPCGCTGLENQKGGLNRRDTLLQSLASRGWDMVPLDIGDQVRRFGRQSEIKFARTAEAFKLMNYSAATFGAEELKLSSTELLLSLTDANGQYSSPFVAANVEILIPDALAKFKVIEVGSKRIGITGVLGDDMAAQLQPGDVTVENAADALKKVIPQLQAANCDFTVLLAHASLESSQKLASAFPIFDLVVTAGGFGEPTYKPEPIPGTKSVMLQVGTKGMYSGIVGLYDDPKEPIKYQRVALSSQFQDSPRIMELFARYQDELKQTGLSGLGLRPLSHPSTREFVGSEKCGECHTKAFAIWKDTPHFHATDSIVTPPGRGNVPRHFDPECISCHVTGWNPQGFYPYTSGYASLEESIHLHGSGCENCHGPGSKHVAAEEGEFEADESLLKKLRQEMQLPLASAQDRCLECHDIDNSPSFHQEGAFEKFWKRVEHYGKD